MPESPHARWEQTSSTTSPEENSSGGDGCWPVPVTSIHTLLSYTTKADLYEPEQQPRHARNVERTSEVNEASRHISSSGADKALAKCKQPCVLKPRLECRDLSESRDGRAHNVKKNSPLDQIALPMSADHRCCLSREVRRRKRRHHQYHESIDNNPKVPVP